MANTPNSLKPTGPTTKMMLEGSRKVCVLNGSRQIGQVTRGEWAMFKVPPESGLPKDIYQLGRTTKASSGKDASSTGQVLFSDGKAVYQLPGKGMVKHPRSALIEPEIKGEKIVDSHSYTVAYANGKGVASSAQTADVARPRAISKGHGVLM